MPNNFFQDMVKTKREGGLSGTPPRRETPKEKESAEEKPRRAVRVREPRNKFASVYDVSGDDGGSQGTSRRIWVVAGICLIFLFFALSFLFSGAKVTLNPKVRDINLDKNFTAIKEGTGTLLPFELIVLSGEETAQLQGGEKKMVSEKAEGTVSIFNNYSSASQRLDIDTRLEGSNGKLYKTKKAIVVPGISGGKPGVVDVDVYANEPGEESNSGLIDFTIVGFKGTPKYDKFTVRSKTEIKGGLSGEVSMVSDQDKASARGELKAKLESKLLQNATATIPEGFILFKDAVFFSIDEEKVGSASADGLAPFTLKGTLYGFLFQEKKLTEKIAEAYVEDYDGSDVIIENIENLKFDLVSQDATWFKDVENLNFKLSGSTRILWALDKDKMISDLTGKSKKDFNQILSTYPNIVSAQLVFHPFWKRTFPEKASRIDVIVNYAQ